MTATRTIPGAARPRTGGSAIRAVRLLDADLEAWERAAQMHREAAAICAADPRTAFELVHRSALKCAGILVDRANRDRRRKLPMNVWTALSRVDASGAERAAQIAPMVAERSRLDRDSSARPDPALLSEHLEATQEHLALVRELIAAEFAGEGAGLAELPLAG